MTDNFEQVKQALLNNRFSSRLRRDGNVDEQACQELMEDLTKLSTMWRSSREVDKELAGWILSTVLMVAGAEEAARRTSAPSSERLAVVLGDLYAISNACFESS